ncbi:hypothetical protein JNJ66_05360 [Candidatus Saccharibacteria bacterium]|nr:hypothetical protein [Candidatus Saccharibacteria bacterium]
MVPPSSQPPSDTPQHHVPLYSDEYFAAFASGHSPAGSRAPTDPPFMHPDRSDAMMKKRHGRQRQLYSVQSDAYIRKSDQLRSIENRFHQYGQFAGLSGDQTNANAMPDAYKQAKPAESRHEQALQAIAKSQGEKAATGESKAPAQGVARREFVEPQAPAAAPGQNSSAGQGHNAGSQTISGQQTGAGYKPGQTIANRVYHDFRPSFLDKDRG